MKRLLNEEKVPCIPLIFDDNKFIVDFKEKSEALILFCKTVFTTSSLEPPTTFLKGMGGGWGWGGRGGGEFSKFSKKKGGTDFFHGKGG